jgi:hypothetical protein
MKRLACFLVAVAVVAIATSGQAATIIGTWDGTPDGWVDWGNGASVDAAANMPSKYNYDSVGGDPALKLTKAGWNQNLAIKLQDNGFVDDFMANKKLVIDLTVPATSQSGWAKIEEITLNAEGAGWGDYKLVAPAFFGWGDGGGGAQSTKLEFDYSAYLSDPDVLALGRNPYWVEIIITTNNDSNHNDFLFQKAALIIPEPASLTLLGLGIAMMLLRRRR